MTAEEFKKLKPEFASLNGEELLNAMEDYMLSQQRGDEIIKQIMPIWKTHTLRWLYYRRIPNLIMSNPRTDRWASNERCYECKRGVNMKVGFMFRDADGAWHMEHQCPHCKKDFIAESNTNISHKIYKALSAGSKLFWKFLDKLHLVRSSIHGRYDMFGDEWRYVLAVTYNMDTGETKTVFRQRKWWEHILIEKPRHNF